MRLSELLCDIQYTLKGDDIDVANIVIDSRKVKKGDLFVAVTGIGADGHNYINAAIEAGAAAVLAERDIDCLVPLVVVENSREALSYAAANMFGNPAKKLRIIGVTGTNGKTTVTHLIKQILELYGSKTGLIGTNHHLIGDEELHSDNTTPEANDLQELFAKMAAANCEFVVMEVSSHSLALNRVAGIEFETAVFTNLTEDHLDFHITMDDYAKEKAKLFKMSRKAIINNDDTYAAVMKKCAKDKVWTYGIDKKADINAFDIKNSERGVQFSIDDGRETAQMRLGIPGRFSVYNALAAICACISLGIPTEDIQKGLIIARGVKGRAEVLPVKQDYTVIIDYAHTPDGVENILKTVRDFAKRNIIVVFGCGGNRDRAKRPIMGNIAAKIADYCIVTSDNPRNENPDDIINDILEGMKGFESKYKVIANRKEAIRQALMMAQKDDIVVLAGKGHETYQVLSDKVIDFDEREIVKEILESM